MRHCPAVWTGAVTQECSYKVTKQVSLRTGLKTHLPWVLASAASPPLLLLGNTTARRISKASAFVHILVGNVDRQMRPHTGV